MPELWWQPGRTPVALMKPVTHRIIIACALVLSGALAHADGGVGGIRVFSCNYDLVLTVEENVAQARSRARVRDGHAIPIEFQEHMVDISVSSGSDGKVSLGLTLFEKSGEFWYQINPEPLTFDGSLGIPVQYQWTDGAMSLDVAIVVSSG